MKKILLVNLGIVPYGDSLVLQKNVVELKKKDKFQDIVLFLEHPPVITVGKYGDNKNILASSEFLQDKNIQVYPVSRGGDVTFHGPGQLVGYPLINLKNFDKSIKSFVYKLEEIFINMLKNNYELTSNRIPGMTGVWINNKKITAMGLSVHHFITMHGFAFNVNTDLNYFSLITPCGITNKGVTSLKQLTGETISIETCMSQISKEFENVFNASVEWISKSDFYKLINLEQ